MAPCLATSVALAAGILSSQAAVIPLALLAGSRFRLVLSKVSSRLNKVCNSAATSDGAWYNDTMNTTHSRVIGHLGEFVDALTLLNNGHYMSVPVLSVGYIDNHPVYTAHRTLIAYRLVDELQLEDAISHFFVLNNAGKQFARDFLHVWRSLPWWRRLWLRIK